MKNIFKLIIVLTLIVNVSCDSNTNELFGDNYDTGWFEMAGYDNETDLVFATSINYDESIEIPVHLNAGINEDGIEISYKITLEEGFLDDDSILGDKSFIFMDKDDFIDFTPVLSTGFYTLKFTLMSSNEPNYTIGLSDDSQPISFIIEVTNYRYFEAKTNFVSSGNQAPDYIARVAQVGGTTNQYNVDTLWGPEFVVFATGNPDYSGLYLNSGIITVNDDNTLVITGDYIDATGSAGALNTTTGVFDFTFIQDGLFASGFEVHTEFTPIN